MKKIIITNQNKELNIVDNSQVLILDVDSVENNLEKKIIIGQNCQVNYLYLSNKADARSFIIGENSQFKAQQVYLGIGDYQIKTELKKGVVFNNQIFIYQNKEGNCRIDDTCNFQGEGVLAEIKVNSLVDNNASIQYYSDLILEKSANFSQANIDMKLYLLSEEARGIMLPGLKIAINEVKATHSASTFNLSDDDAFYLQSRGLDKESIKKILLNSILSSFKKDINDASFLSDLDKFLKI